MAPAQTTATAGSGEMCRLTICGPTSRVELAVPAHVPLTDLMPTLLGHLDPALATSGLAHGGWALQRLGEPPLDEEGGTAAAGLYDGDVLHLRPRDDLLPLADFDDLVDGVHTGLSKREDTWRPALTRRTCVAAMGTCAAAAVLITTLATTGWAAAFGAGVLTLLLLAGAAVVSRVVGDQESAAVLAGVAVFASAVAGLAVPMGGATPQHWLSEPGALAAGVALAVAAGAARFLLTERTAPFSALAVVGTFVAGTGAIAAFSGLGSVAAASIAVTVALVLIKLAPSVATRAAGLTVEAVPTTAEEFQQGLDPLPSDEVLTKAARADALLTSFLVALGVVTTAGLVVVASRHEWDAAAFVVAVAGLLLLHARELSAVWHRLSAIVPAAAGLTTTVCVWASHLPVVWWSLVLVGLLAAAFAALAGAHLLPGRKLVPRWGSWGDIAHWVCALAVIPLTLSLSDVYTTVMNIFA
ncbi:type VII secretion integral membrane protein EccD [Lentzea roselyniae]|uniref:Type VII secretion integral membrane protein EccD n=1 Tax=Lentzea roselyniae TaxID=531940 RepID=A0ABP7C2L8_9PSEU